METRSYSLLDFFDSEIERIEKDQTRQGLNRWVLFAALGTCLWLVSLEIERTTMSWKYASFLLLGLVILIETVKDIDTIFSFSRNPKARPTLFTSDTFGYRIRWSSLLTIVVYVVLVKAAIDFSMPSLPFFKTVCIAMYGLGVFVYLSRFEQSFSDYPIFINLLKPSSLIVLSLMLLIDLFLSLSIIITIKTLPVVPSISELRIVGIAATIYWLLRRLIDTSPNPILKSLRKVRRDFTFGKIEAIEAQQEFEIVLNGISAIDYLQTYVNNVVLSAKNLEQRLLQHSIKNHNSELESGLIELTHAMNSAIWRIRLIYRNIPGIKQEILSKLDKITEALNSLYNSGASANPAFDKLMKLWSKRLKGWEKHRGTDIRDN